MCYIGREGMLYEYVVMEYIYLLRSRVIEPNVEGTSLWEDGKDDRARICDLLYVEADSFTTIIAFNSL